MIFRYAGPDVVDLKEADWIELIDNENRTIRIAFARSTHLPIRKTVDTRDPATQLKSQEIEYYSLYHPIDGIQTPFQITRERNGIKIYQVFLRQVPVQHRTSRFALHQRISRRALGQNRKKDKKKQAKQDKTDSTKDCGLRQG